MNPLSKVLLRRYLAARTLAPRTVFDLRDEWRLQRNALWFFIPLCILLLGLCILYNL